jgi:hypothetical protein
VSSWKGRLRGSAGIGTALVAAVALLVLPAAGKQPVPAPAAMDLAWPQVKRAALAATLADGTAYDPELFLTADTSIGTAPSKDRTWVRLLEHRATGPDVLQAAPEGISDVLGGHRGR